MNDPVLNRKMFRATALRTRAIRPQRYNVGAGIMGVEGTPYFTNESQGMGPPLKLERLLKEVKFIL
jgi:hypothetical protein